MGLHVLPELLRAPLLAMQRRVRLQRMARALVRALPWFSLAIMWATVGRRLGWYGNLGYLGGLFAILLTLVGWLGLAALRPLGLEHLSQRLDDAHGFSGRLTAATGLLLCPPAPVDAAPSPTDMAFRRAAIEDGLRHAPLARPALAAPWQRPAGLMRGIAALACCAGVMVLTLPTPRPTLVAVRPNFGPPGATVRIVGDALGHSPAPALRLVFVPAQGQPMPLAISAWTPTQITAMIPSAAPVSDGELRLERGAQVIARLGFRVVDPADARFHREDALTLDTYDQAYIASLIDELTALAKAEGSDELAAYADHIKHLLAKAARGEVSKAELMAQLAKAEAELKADKAEASLRDDVAQSTAWQQAGAALAKGAQAQALGQALDAGDLRAASRALEQLAQKLETQALDKATRQALAKDFEAAAKALDAEAKQQAAARPPSPPKDPHAEAGKAAAQQAAMAEAAEQLRRLKEAHAQAKPAERAELERRLQKQRAELARLRKETAREQQAATADALKRLQKQMVQVAETLSQEQAAGGPKTAEALREAARETARLDRDQRKQAAARKAATQMEDLKEALRRAKQNKSKAPQDPFNKANKRKEFSRRAGGGQGQRKMWQPGQGRGGQGQGGGQAGADKAGAGGKQWGSGHDDNLEGDATQKSGNTKDQALTGVAGQGTTRRETILAAAQRGFATRAYAQVYADYQRVVEEVMNAEHVPASHKHVIKKYFTHIHPTAASESP